MFSNRERDWLILAKEFLVAYKDRTDVMRYKA